MIELDGVYRTYAMGGQLLHALNDVSETIEAGDYVAVVGPSGSGKSTMLNMITGIDRHTSGEVFVGDQAVHTLSENQLARWRGRHVGVVFQFFQLLPTLTVIENVMLPMDFCDQYDMMDRPERAMELLELVGLAEYAHKLPAAISGGQQQSVAIARALANDPPILIADEPTGNLDRKNAEIALELIMQLNKSYKTSLIMVTHDLHIAERLDTVYVLEDGLLQLQ